MKTEAKATEATSTTFRGGWEATKLLRFGLWIKFVFRVITTFVIARYWYHTNVNVVLSSKSSS